MSSLRGVLTFSLLMTWIAGQANAEPPAIRALLQPLQWRSIGPFRGGRVLAVTGVPGEPNHFYFGAVNGGVWESHDAGRTWAPIFDSVQVGSLGALAVAPSDPKVIYAGTGEADMRSDIAQGIGVFGSVDGGRSWQSIGLEDSQQIGRILVDPTDPKVVLVAALGHPYGSNETRGVFRSIDGGRTWKRSLYKDADSGAIDLAAEPGQFRTVYASLWQTRRPPWNVYPPSNGPGSGLYQSLDGGQSWTALSGRGLPAKPGRIGIAVSPSQPRRVFALIDAIGGGLYRSDDRGASWTRVSDDSRIWKRGWYFGGVTIDPTNADIVYVCNTAMYRSDDGGSHFIPIKGAPGGDDYHQLWIDPADPQRRILGVDQGAVVTVNGGATWSSWYNQPTGQFYHVITDNRFPYWVYGAQQDSGAAGIPSRTGNIDGINLTHFREVTAGGESDYIATDPEEPEVIFGGRVSRLDLHTAQTQHIPSTLAHPDLYRGTWTLPLVFGSPASHALYFANQRIFRTTDQGASWQPISPDLSREVPQTPGTLDPSTVVDSELTGARRGVVYAIGPSPRDDRLLWAGTDDGLVWRSTDGGQHWENVTPASVGAWSKVAVVEPSHFASTSAYIAVDRHRLDDPRPYVYRTRDDGASWKLIVDGLSDGGTLNAVNVVREDPVQRGLLYCGTEHGVYVSFDDGDHWQALQQNLPRTSVRDLQVHGGDLVIATHGRGLWIMDDIAMLRSLAADPVGGVRLFPPAVAYRLRPTGFTGTPMPRDEAVAADPPLGAAIDYALDDTPTVTLRITDARGTTVRTFSSDEKRSPPDLAKIETAPEWVVLPVAPATGAGAHRLVWDLHYAPPQPPLEADDPTEEERGVWAPPGQYRIELNVGGKSYGQSLTVAADPRIKLPASAYAQQFELARDIERARVEIATALAEAKRVHEGIAAHQKKADGETATALANADRRLIAVSDIAPEKSSPDFLGPPPQTVGGLRYLGAAFHSLAQAVDGADIAPTPDARRGYARHRALLDQALADWTQFKATTLAQLNAQLRSTGAASITP